MPVPSASTNEAACTLTANSNAATEIDAELMDSVRIMKSLEITSNVS